MSTFASMAMIDEASADADRSVAPLAGGPSRLLTELCAKALSLYGARVLDNIDLDRLDSLQDKARVIAQALMERGDARAYSIARRIMAAARR